VSTLAAVAAEDAAATAHVIVALGAVGAEAVALGV
jgi:hypothetical protein